jgi:hypothetical protein
MCEWDGLAMTLVCISFMLPTLISKGMVTRREMLIGQLSAYGCTSRNVSTFSRLLCQQMHSPLKHKMLQLTLKISIYMAPTCFGPFGPSSGSISRNLVELFVKIHR